VVNTPSVKSDAICKSPPLHTHATATHEDQVSSRDSPRANTAPTSPKAISMSPAVQLDSVENMTYVITTPPPNRDHERGKSPRELSSPSFLELTGLVPVPR
jgi:hypothetical protein